jgi:hypothetical protein
VRPAAPATRHPVGASPPGQDRRNSGARGARGRTLRANQRSSALARSDRAGVQLITSMEVIDWPTRKLAFGDDSLADLAQSIKG